jgi:hypothetical protein
VDPLFREGLRYLGIGPETAVDPTEAARAIQFELGFELPASARDLLRFPGLMPAIAAGYEGTTTFPTSPELVDDSFLPREADPILELLIENQAVVAWGLPLERGANPPVLVGWRDTGDPLIEFAPSVAEFVYAMAWDCHRFEQRPLLQAQAKPLDPPSLAALRSRYREVTETRGFPADNTYRFEGEGGLMVTLWSGKSQCDWFVTAGDPVSLAREVEWQLTLSDLMDSFWSNDPEAEELLTKLRPPKPDSLKSLGRRGWLTRAFRRRRN